MNQQIFENYLKDIFAPPTDGKTRLIWTVVDGEWVELDSKDVFTKGDFGIGGNEKGQ